MGHITQQSLAFDRKDQIENSDEYKVLVEQEANLIKEIETFREALTSAQADLAELRKKLRPLKKMIGNYKSLTKIVYEYVKANPGKRFMDVVKYLDSLGYNSFNGGIAVRVRHNGTIIEQEDGTYIPGILREGKRGAYGARVSTVIDYARKVEWFEARECYLYVKSKLPDVVRGSIYTIFYNKPYKDRFDVDKSGKYIKYRLKDEYRSK